MAMKYIATDSRAFSELIRGGYLYIDKTENIYKLIRKGAPSKFWFLSRPRRFGKSLTIDTLYNLLRGNKELFKGTYIYDKYEFESFPVIRLNMIFINEHDRDSIRLQLVDLIKKTGVSLDDFQESDDIPSIPSAALASLIEKTRRKYGKMVAILIDEYDYPLMENMHGECFEDVRNELANFYNILKAAIDDIHFCFLTGVTRFPHVSIFSKLNNLTDISNDPEFAALCGYTDDEVDRYFAPYMEKYFEDNDIQSDEEKKAFRKNIKDYYNGYCFSDDVNTTVYNPVSLGSFFNGGCVFKNYWI